MACWILVSRPRIKPMPSAVEAQILNHWTSREVQYVLFCGPYGLCFNCSTQPRAQATTDSTTSGHGWFQYNFIHKVKWWTIICQPLIDGDRGCICALSGMAVLPLVALVHWWESPSHAVCWLFFPSNRLAQSACGQAAGHCFIPLTGIILPRKSERSMNFVGLLL